jgi:hypothetical protein
MSARRSGWVRLIADRLGAAAVRKKPGTGRAGGRRCRRGTPARPGSRSLGRCRSAPTDGGDRHGNRRPRTGTRARPRRGLFLSLGAGEEPTPWAPDRLDSLVTPTTGDTAAEPDGGRPRVSGQVEPGAAGGGGNVIADGDLLPRRKAIPASLNDSDRLTSDHPQPTARRRARRRPIVMHSATSVAVRASNRLHQRHESAGVVHQVGSVAKAVLSRAVVYGTTRVAGDSPGRPGP